MVKKCIKWSRKKLSWPLLCVWTTSATSFYKESSMFSFIKQQTKFNCHRWQIWFYILHCRITELDLATKSCVPYELRKSHQFLMYSWKFLVIIIFKSQAKFTMFKNLRKKLKKWMYYGPTDRPTNRPTNIVTYRVA